MQQSFSFGIEEEYFLVDAAISSVVRTMPQAFLEAAKKAVKDTCGGQVTSEMLQGQIEVATAPHTDMKAAREELRHLRRTLAEVGAEHGLAILAAGTHPTASWQNARQTESERYDAVMEDLQMIGRRNMLCGMHVHVELPDPDARVGLMTRMLPFVPLFVALATSSPFWQSRPTGLMGYRLAAYDLAGDVRTRQTRHCESDQCAVSEPPSTAPLFSRNVCPTCPIVTASNFACSSSGARRIRSTRLSAIFAAKATIFTGSSNPSTCS
jgi:Glutamate-cysteine ligase family 2(GCS2)